MKNIIFLMLGLMLSGCHTTPIINQAVCTAQDRVVTASSNLLVAKLNCANPAAVRADVLTFVQKANMCKPADGNFKGPIGNLLCGTITDGVMVKLQGKIPPAWECTGGVAAADTRAQLLALCQKTL